MNKEELERKINSDEFYMCIALVLKEAKGVDYAWNGVNRATLSLPLWLQMVGRGSRLFNNKDHFVVIDQGGNAQKHELWEAPREWHLHKKPKRKGGGDGVATVKICDHCQAMNFSNARKCSSCGEPFKEEEKKLKQAEFVNLTKKMARRGMKEQFDVKAASSGELTEYAKKKGYKLGWVYHQLKQKGEID